MAQEDGSDKGSDKGSGSAKFDPVILRDRYQIDPAQHIPDLDMPNARAFVATDKRNNQRNLYALVCEGHLPPRINLMRKLRGVTSPGLIPLIEWGTVDWPPIEGRCVSVVYERPMGGRVMKSMDAVFQPVPDQQFIKTIVKPLIAALTEIQSHSTVHRAIRPTNLYWIDKEQTRIALGDCTTSPPGYHQPMICETVESGMAAPEGRGAGYYPEDMYALGATLVAISMGRCALVHESDDTILTHKINNGSYATVVGEERVPLGIIELVRGMLVDDPDQRWTLEAIDMWMNGRRMNPMQTKQDKRSQRPFMFRNTEYFTRRALAHALTRDWEAGATPLMEGKVEIWLRRGLELHELADSVANVIRASGARAKDVGMARDMAMASALTLMDPAAPIRYGRLRIHMEAFGTALAISLTKKQDIRPYVDLVQKDFSKTWIAAQESFSTDHGRYGAEFREMQTYLTQATKGGGVERCLYEMTEYVACRSSLLKDQCVLEIADLLPALERVSGKVDPKTPPTDRHVVAFIAARYAKDTMPQIHAMNDTDPRKATLGMLAVLALVQWKMGPPSLPGLASWLGGLMTPVIESYHGRDRRRQLEKEVPKLVRKGNLPELFKLLDNAEERQADFDDFAVARLQYAQAAQQVAALESGNFRVSENSEKLGQQVAASISAAVSILAVIFVLLAHLV
ncbi:MAG: protein kinase family protein [Rhodospirillum sp.]|nr:protein kinase family protein [Rhodospirillum sp.]MCF8488837.1 protein kinase family protein [Rhodospirillum sp.]MCF8501328.1 protein kinase family protein [Rhodospirillum sp.]